MFSRKKIVIAAGLLLFVLGSYGRADHITSLFEQAVYGEFAMGKGAAAWGMGGTGLAMSGDPFASSWNPAGLADLARPSLVLSYSAGRLDNAPGYRHFVYPVYGGGVLYGSIRERESRASGQSIEFAALSFPLTVFRHRIAVQLSRRRQGPYPAGLDYGYQYRYQHSYRFDYDYRYEADGSGGFDLITLSLASEVIRGLRVGVNFQHWSNGFEYLAEEIYEYSLENWYGMNGTWQDKLGDQVDFRVSGFSLDAGVLVKLGNRIRAGLVVRSGCTARLEFGNSALYRNGYTGLASAQAFSGSGRLSLPASFGLGVSFRPSARLTLAADFVRTLWSKARLRDFRRASSGGAVPEPRDYAFPSLRLPEVIDQKDTSHFHCGAEYRFRRGVVELPLRVGAFVDGHYFYSDAGDVVRTVGFTLGFGLRWRQATLDVAWVKSASESRFDRDVVRASLAYGF